MDASVHEKRVAGLQDKIEKSYQREDALQRLIGQREEEIEQLIYERDLKSREDERKEVTPWSTFHHLPPTKANGANQLNHEFGIERERSLQAIVNRQQSRKERDGREGEQRAVVSRLKKENRESGSRIESPVEQLPERELAVAVEDENMIQEKRFGEVYAMEPGDRDDLKKIKGVGEALEARLNQFGVYRFKQIALWTNPVANEFVAVLPFGEWLVRDRWIDQARELHELIHGERISN